MRILTDFAPPFLYCPPPLVGVPRKSVAVLLFRVIVASLLRTSRVKRSKNNNHNSCYTQRSYVTAARCGQTTRQHISGRLKLLLTIALMHVASAALLQHVCSDEQNRAKPLKTTLPPIPATLVHVCRSISCVINAVKQCLHVCHCSTSTPATPSDLIQTRLLPL